MSTTSERKRAADMVILDDPVQPDTPETVAKRIKALKEFYAIENAALRAKTGRMPT